MITFGLLNMKKTYKISNIFGGISPTFYFGQEGSFLNSLGIDPDGGTTSISRTGGIITPISYGKFSGTEFTGYPLWTITQPKSANSYIYTSNGKLHSFDTDLAMRATEGAVNFPVSLSSASGNGGVYYNNYIYLFKQTNVDRYGPMNGTPALTADVWTGATLGTQTALANTTYPTLQATPLPNHVAHVHGDNSIYFADVVNGAGVLHRIQTKKVTVEGDTDDNSAYNVLDFPSGMYPTCIESYGTDLVTGCIQGSSAVINQGRASLYFWDTFDDTFYNEVPLPDAFITAMKNINGVLYIWSGNGNLGCRLSRYIGGDSVEQVAFVEFGVPPFPGGVDSYGDKVVWGTRVYSPVTEGCVLSFGSKDSRLPKALNNIAISSSGSASGLVTALKVVQQASGVMPRYVVGWGDGTNYGLDKLGATDASRNIWQSPVFLTGGKFCLKKIKIPLTTAVGASTEMVVYVVVNSVGTTYTLPTVTNTNYSGKRNIIFKEPDLKSVIGDNDFYIEVRWATGSTKHAISFPIEIEVDLYEDEQ